MAGGRNRVRGQRSHSISRSSLPRPLILFAFLPNRRIEGYNLVGDNIPDPIKDKVGQLGAEGLERAKRASWDKLPEGVREGVRKPGEYVKRTARRSSDALSSLMDGIGKGRAGGEMG